jgi:sporulation protein YlmC with PRC-barrel domain
MLASEFIKMQVYAAEMQAMGKVKDLIIDQEKCFLAGFVVEVQKEIAKSLLESKLIIRNVKVQVPISTVDKIGDGIVLKFSLDELKGQVQKI